MTATQVTTTPQPVGAPSGARTAGFTGPGREVRFGEDELIVSKTDARGHLTYVNDVFERVSAFSAAELVGRPHNVIRHPDMPRGVFKLLWDTIGSGSEIFAYVKNATKTGDYYWVLAHVTPTVVGGRIVGYHSNRRSPSPQTVARLTPVYRRMLDAERGLPGARAAEASLAVLEAHLADAGVGYEEFVWSHILETVS